MLLGVGIWISSRWNIWFSNIPETCFETSNIPDRITLTPGADFVTQRNISWRCGDKIADASVVLASAMDTTIWKAEGSIVEARGAIDAFYTAHIINLAPGDIYRYKIECGRKVFQMGYAKMCLERKRKKEGSFILVMSQDTIGGQSHEMFAKLYNKSRDVDFWACGGDLIERPLNKYWNYLYATTDSILAMMPILNTVGNHDYVKSISPYVDKRWARTFVYPENGAKRACARATI